MESICICAIAALRCDEPTFENIAGATSESSSPRMTITMSNSMSVKPGMKARVNVRRPGR